MLPPGVWMIHWTPAVALATQPQAGLPWKDPGIPDGGEDTVFVSGAKGTPMNAATINPTLAHHARLGRQDGGTITMDPRTGRYGVRFQRTSHRTLLAVDAVAWRGGCGGVGFTPGFTGVGVRETP
jgi:hypothetical protein